MNKKAIICDFDGTLSDYKHREHLRTSDWNSYISLSRKDTLIEQVNDILERFKDSYTIIILSARGEKCRVETEEWLADKNVHYDELILKNDEDMRDDCLVKLDLLRDKILDRFDVYFALDDRSSVAELYRQNDIFVFQCGNGY